MELSTNRLVLAPDAAIDLQLHTVYSDGTWQPDQLLDYLRREHFGLAAITDHDRADTAGAFQRLALANRLPLLVAVEMSATWNGAMTDILCYGFDPDSGALAALAQSVQHRQRANTRAAYARLQRDGCPYLPAADPAAADLLALLEQPAAQQPHAFAALLKQRGCPTPGKLLFEAGVEFVTNEVAPIVAAAHQDGALCILAHPGRSDGFVQYDAVLLDRLRAEAPIDGLEAYYPVHTPEQTAFYAAYAREQGLLVSSGSDSHGPNHAPIPYRAELSRDLLARLGIRVMPAAAP